MYDLANVHVLYALANIHVLYHKHKLRNPTQALKKEITDLDFHTHTQKLIPNVESIPHAFLRQSRALGVSPRV
jgi:hypothetical protein